MVGGWCGRLDGFVSEYVACGFRVDTFIHSRTGPGPGPWQTRRY